MLEIWGAWPLGYLYEDRGVVIVRTVFHSDLVRVSVKIHRFDRLEHRRKLQNDEISAACTVFEISFSRSFPKFLEDE